jgi:hypothetical protein
VETLVEEGRPFSTLSLRSTWYETPHWWTKKVSFFSECNDFFSAFHSHLKPEHSCHKPPDTRIWMSFLPKPAKTLTSTLTIFPLTGEMGEPFSVGNDRPKLAYRAMAAT